MTQPTATVQDCPNVFVHRKRRNWGLGLLAWEQGNRRGYVFESGELRVFDEPFFSLMLQVERPDQEVRALHRSLKPALDAARADRGAVPKAPSVPGASTFDAQLESFLGAYPAGFRDARWLQGRRGASAPDRLVAHRSRAVEEARTLLSASRLSARIHEQDFAAAYDDVHRVLSSTDLVPAADRALAEVAELWRRRQLVLAVNALLHGRAVRRLGSFLLAFHEAARKPASWQLATALPALLDPDNHVAVSPTLFRAQAKRVALRLSIPKLPTEASYMACLALARQIGAKLSEHGTPAGDLMDVHDFICSTAGTHAPRRSRGEAARLTPAPPE